MKHFDVLIIGAGISGIGMGCRLKMNLPGLDFAILEGRDAIGGTWDLFRYPGVRSDSDMHTFGFNFRPWIEDRDIASGEAIIRYLNDTVDAYHLRPHIRFQHRVEGIAWSSTARRWTVTVRRNGAAEPLTLSCRFLVTCTGYYRYDKGYQPDFPGIEGYSGLVVHPQRWPEGLETAGKRIVVIGSGATAVTLVPALAKTAAHVTMLQRSPTYIYSRPAADPITAALRRYLPLQIAHRLARARNIVFGWFVYRRARAAPDRIRTFLRNMAEEGVGPDIDVDVHFNPRYDPWDQRLCLIPDGDLFAALKSGDASIVTDTIARFTPEGLALASGETLDADIVVTATGLNLQFLGGATVAVDGRAVAPNQLLSYRGMMFANMPNWACIIGYTTATWTLKADLTGAYICRLLKYMRKHGYDLVVPTPQAADMPTQTMMASLSSAGYVRRAADKMPRRGMTPPWRNRDSYPEDFASVRLSAINDGVLRFAREIPRPTDPLLFFGKTAVVTGAASGIGAALANALAARGCHLALLDINAERLEEVAAQARVHGGTVTAHRVDMGDAAAIAAFPSALAAAHPHVDLLFNNAGVALAGDFAEVSAEDFAWLMNINFFGVVNMTRALLPALKARPEAHIINISSVYGLIAPPGQSAYAASKFAVRGFSESLRHELAQENATVGVSVVHPGGVKTRIAKDARVGAHVDLSDEALDQRRQATERMFSTDAETAARTILAGVEARKPRILIGNDARLIAWLERLFPTTNLTILDRLTRAFSR